MPSIAGELARVMPGAFQPASDELDRFQIGGLRPSAVARPDTPEQAAAVLALAHEHGWAVAPRGGGTLLDLGNPLERLDIVLDVGALAAILDYQPDDMTVTAQAGVTLAALAQLLSERGQLLPLDAPLPERATVGGTIAANIAGPRRLRFGTARDVVIGMQFATPAGGLARSGGRVVKNVAGYDLGKLHVGGLGSAGVITEATFKLQPAPAGRGALVAAFPSLDAACAAARAILHSQLFPAALELLNGDAARQLPDAAYLGGLEGEWVLAALLLGLPAAVERAARDIDGECAGAGASGVATLERDDGDRLFAGIRDFGRANGSEAALILRAAVLPSEAARATRLLQDTGTALGTAPALIVRPSAGLALGYWRGSIAESAAATIDHARQEFRRFDGTLTVERAPLGALPGVDRWGVAGPDLVLMRRLKDAYDPARVLNPGRFAAGL